VSELDVTGEPGFEDLASKMFLMTEEFFTTMTSWAGEDFVREDVAAVYRLRSSQGAECAQGSACTRLPPLSEEGLRR